jgi:hypothetical protein
MFAIDYDGTIAGTNFVKSRWIRENLGLDVPPHLCDHTDCAPLIGGEEVYGRLAAYAYSAEGSRLAPPVPGALEALKQIARAGPIIIMSHRLAEQVPYAREWLAARGVLGLVKDIVSSAGQRKVEFARRLGCRVLIDDDGRHLAGDAPDLVRIHLRFGSDGPAAEHDGVWVCATWDEVLARALNATKKA